MPHQAMQMLSLDQKLEFDSFYSKFKQVLGGIKLMKVQEEE